ncbi:SRPBCC family protein [Gracilimonas tropica]|uniref:SRPBCC family protein n=1 Tax=Gracilimonas tropica TaxID=454600 RepID=UPI00037C41B2|nr:SRPBCC family protein [Gracilimonas tropica]
MSYITINKKIEAPKEQVFEIVADIRNFSKVIPEIKNVEFLSEQQYGVGTKYKETRDMNGREASTVLEVTELVENEHIRLISDAGGTVWDSIFKVEEKEGGTELSLVMEARPYKFLPKIIAPFMKGFMRNAIEKDMDATKRYCEAEV